MNQSLPLNQVLHGDCLDRMKELPDSSVDSVITDPPYGLGFMGNRWDHDVPSALVFEEMLRVAKPGAFLLCFAGTRKWHRMAVNIEDAGWQIRDTMMWLYGSGMPKSYDISKGIDKAAGVEREVIGKAQYSQPAKSGHHAGLTDPNVKYDGERFTPDVTAPASDDAKRWEGYGTSMKPAVEPVIVAVKTTDETERLESVKNLSGLSHRLWSMLFANDAKRPFPSNQAEYEEACDSVRKNAEQQHATPEGSQEPTDTLRFVEATLSVLNTVLSWRSTLEEALIPESTSTTSTEKKTIINWRTLRFYTSQLTPESIIKAKMIHGGCWYDVDSATRYLNAACMNIQGTRMLFAHETAIEKGLMLSPDEVDKKTSCMPIIVAMKPLSGTFVENALEHGVAGLNIDECRISHDEPIKTTSRSGRSNAAVMTDKTVGFKITTVASADPAGRFPANLILDEESASLLEAQTGTLKSGSRKEGVRTGLGYYGGSGDGGPAIEGSEGGASRFFYTAKASRAEREAGLEELPPRNAGNFDDDGHREPGERKNNHTAPQPVRNIHPTIKPLDLMRYLCRLTKTPTGGVVLDPFLGSGTTAIAARLEGRSFIGIEKESEYVEIARARVRPHLSQKTISEMVFGGGAS